MQLTSLFRFTIMSKIRIKQMKVNVVMSMNGLRTIGISV